MCHTKIMPGAALFSEKQRCNRRTWLQECFPRVGPWARSLGWLCLRTLPAATRGWVKGLCCTYRERRTTTTRQWRCVRIAGLKNTTMAMSMDCGAAGDLQAVIGGVHCPNHLGKLSGRKHCSIFHIQLLYDPACYSWAYTQMDGANIGSSNN